jgi:hypothetical protein
MDWREYNFLRCSFKNFGLPRSKQPRSFWPRERIHALGGVVSFQAFSCPVQAARVNRCLSWRAPGGSRRSFGTRGQGNRQTLFPSFAPVPVLLLPQCRRRPIRAGECGDRRTKAPSSNWTARKEIFSSVKVCQGFFATCCCFFCYMFKL